MPVAEPKQLVKYVPTIQQRKWITNNTANHGGIHKQEEFKKGVRMIEQCAHNFRNPRLFHICFTGAEENIYKTVMVRFCRLLTAAHVDYRYKAALEVDTTRGVHFHVMIVLGTEQQTHRFITSSNEREKTENESALRKAVRRTWDDCTTLDYRVNAPKSRSGEVAFIQFNQTNMVFFNEAVEWMSYIYKVRSKPSVGTIYFSGRQQKRTKTQVPTCSISPFVTRRSADSQIHVSPAAFSSNHDLHSVGGNLRQLG